MLYSYTHFTETSATIQNKLELSRVYWNYKRKLFIGNNSKNGEI